MVTSGFPVFQVAIGLAVLLAAAGVTLAVVPALRRRRALWIAWVVSVGAVLLVALVGFARMLNEFT